MERKGLGRYKGKGYYNIVHKDPYVHSLSAKGVKTYVPFSAPPKKDWNITDFGDEVTLEKKGLIKELARKVVGGVEWAIHWEKEHLPKQKQWVKDQYHKAKDMAKRGLDKVKDMKEDQQQDLEDVRDELDVDDDGTQDIQVSELESVNEQIRDDLNQIDLDGNNVPDHVEDKPLDITYSTTTGQPSKAKNLLDTFAHTLTKSAKKGRQFVETQIAERKAEHTALSLLTDKQLEEYAVREGKGIFGANTFEKELYRRQKDRTRIESNVIAERQKAKERYMPKKAESGSTTSGFDAFGFLNPINTLKKVKK